MEYTILTENQKKIINIQNELDEFISVCFGEVLSEDDKSKKKFKEQYISKTIEYRVRVKLTEILRRERTLPNTEVFKLSSTEIHELYNNYLLLISYINKSISYIPNKIEFLAFSKISISAFEHLLNNSTDDVKQECADIESDLINFTLSAAEQGQSKESSSKIRLKAKIYGHSVVEVGDAESVIDKAKDAMNAGQFVYELKNIADMKALIDKKKNGKT